MVKALAAGANVVMVGSLVAGCEESIVIAYFTFEAKSDKI